MKDNIEAGRISRRNFLKTAGAATGALAIPAILSASPAEAAPRRKKRRKKVNRRRKLPTLGVALLVPPSGICPSLAENLASGMRLRFAQLRASGGRNLRVDVVDAGVGEGKVMEAAKRAKGAALAVGFAPPRISAKLSETFDKEGKAFIALDTGADVARSGEEEPKLSNSLHLSRSEFAFGAWAAENLGWRAVMSASAYDGGFDAYHAFRLGFEGAGGEVADEHITHHPGRSSDLPPSLVSIKDSSPDFVYAAYCGKHAVEFVGAYERAGMKNIPLAGSAFLADESILPEQGTSALGIKTCLSWASGLPNDANRRFVTEYRKKERRTPGAVAALGFEVASGIAAALRASKGKPDSRFRSALENTAVSGPRGRVKIGATEAPARVREVRKSSGHLVNAVISNAPGADESLAALRDSIKSGWLNTYLSL